MPRPYHSASSLALGDHDRDGCEYAWALTYIAGQRAREVPWRDIASGRVRKLKPGQIVQDPRTECTTKQYSASLGGALHAVGEAYFLGRRPDWIGLPGQIYASGLQFLPDPKSCRRVEVEAEIGTIELPKPWKPKGMTHCMDFEGLRLAGKRDLVVWHVEFRTPGGLILHDYKSTSSILDYAKSTEDLKDDVQCCAYALDLMRRYRLEAVSCRWIYFETRDIRRAIPVDVLITRGQAEKTLRAQIPLARRLDSIQGLADARRNPFACEAYGRPGVINCSHHVCNGGTCDYKRPMSALIKIAERRERKETEMADDKDKAAQRAELEKRLEAARAAKAAGAKPATQAAPAQAASAEKPKAPRKPKAQPEPEPEPDVHEDTSETAPASEAVGAIRALRDRIAELEEQNAELQTELDAIHEALEE